MTEKENNQGKDGQQNFGLPEGYFQRSAKSITNKLEWEDEHKNYPALLGLRQKNTFALPPDYFALAAIKFELIDTPLLLSLTKKHSGFGVPDDFFEQAQTKELATQLKDNGNELSGFSQLNRIKKQNVFEVSEDYFETNARLLATLLAPQRSARIVDLFFARKSFVAAALLTLCLGLWLYSVYVRPARQAQDCGTIACIEKRDLLKAKNLENIDNDELYELVSPADLEKKLNGSDVKINTTNDSSFNEPDFDELPDEI